MKRAADKIIFRGLLGSLPLVIADAGYASSGASGGATVDIPWTMLTVGLFGGLALFLYGLEKMSDGLRMAAGHQMRTILAKLTSNRLVALMMGAFITMVIQSSSATTVMLVSFVQAELMTFTQSLGVILGSDIGTTVTVQLIAFKLSDYALLIVAAGFGLRLMAKRRALKTVGDIFFGCGLLFFGMKVMSDAMSPLHNVPGFTDLLLRLENPALGLLVGLVFTALIHSSGAFIGILIVLAEQDLISLEAAIPMVLGANIGTCITAVMATIGMSIDAKRVALAHVLFKIAGVLLFVFWIPALAGFIRGLASSMGSGPGREIANAHTVFNVGMAFIFLPFTTLFALLIKKIMPDRTGPRLSKEMLTWYLDEGSIKTPEVAIGLARTEISRMAKLLERMLRAVIIPFISDERFIDREITEKEEAALLRREIPKRDEIFPELTLLEGIDMREKKIDFLEEKIGDYLNRVLRQNASEENIREAMNMMSIAKDLESIGDLIHRNIMPLIAKKRELDEDFSEEGKEELMIYHQKVCNHIRLLKEAFAETSPDRSCRIMGQERIYLDLESKYRLQHLHRVHRQQKESLATHEVHMELLDLLKQIVVYSSNIALTFTSICRETAV